MIVAATLTAVGGVPVLPVLVAVVCVIVFVATFFSPTKSISLQHRLQAWLQRRKEGSAAHTPDRVEGAVTGPIDASQRAVDKAAGAGRGLRGKLPL